MNDHLLCLFNVFFEIKREEIEKNVILNTLKLLSTHPVIVYIKEILNDIISLISYISPPN